MNMNELTPPTWSDVTYGPHARNTYDFWQAHGEHAPIFVFIHGGGWTFGDKQQHFPAPLLDDCLAAGLAVASVNYRYSTMAPLPAPIADAARAIQHIRHNAGRYRIDPVRLATYGVSAGACTSFNLALGPDFADPSSADPVSRESSRPLCAGGRDGQTAIDPVLLRAWLGDDILQHRMPNLAVGEPTAESMLAHYPQHQAMLQRFSPFLQVDPATAVPIFLEYTSRAGKALMLPAAAGGVAIHHSAMGLQLKAKMDALDLECHLYMHPQGGENRRPFLHFLKTKMTPD